jgi:hypothetical protein
MQRDISMTIKSCYNSTMFYVSYKMKKQNLKDTQDKKTNQSIITRARCMAQGVECLPCKHKALNSKQSPTETK